MRPIYETPDPRDPVYVDEDPPVCECGAEMIEVSRDSWLCEDCDAAEISERALEAELERELAQGPGGEE